MSIHDAFLEVAATSLDFDLEDDERAELDRHVAGCESCRRAVEALRDDAAAIASGTGPGLSTARSDAILAAALRPPGSGPSARLAAIGAVLVLAVGIVVGGIVLLRPPDKPTVAVVPSAASTVPGQSGEPTASSGPTTRPSTGTPRPAATPTVGVLPVHASALERGADVRMAAGPDGDLYVSTPASGDTVLTHLDGGGKTQAGWPILLPGASPCGLLLAVADGSLRVVCQFPRDQVGEGPPPERAFAFDAGGSPMAGWPVDIPCCFTGRILGDQLVVYARQALGSDFEAGQLAGKAWIVAVAADGAVHNGAQVPFYADCCLDSWAVGPDGVAYGTLHHLAAGSTPATSELAAVSYDGIPAGFPVTIDGTASGPGFDLAGRIHVTVVSPVNHRARTLVFGPDGLAASGGSGELDMTATSNWRGAGGAVAAPPLVGPDGTTFVIDDTKGTTVIGIGPTGRVVTGWPYRSNLGLEVIGSCGPNDAACGQFRAEPTVGPGKVLYVLHEAASASAGGSVVAIDQDGRVVDGWPVNLKRPGAEFWSVVVGQNSTAYVLAIEPEPNGSYSATIVAISEKSTTDYTATIIEP